VVQSVYVQTNWPGGQGEPEAAWIQAEAARSGWPHAMVAYADMSVPDVRPQLDRLKTYPLVRGVRMQLHWHENEMFRFAPTPDQFMSDNFRRNLAQLADYGFSFDLQVFPSQMKDAAQLVAQFPKTHFILVHAGMLTDAAPATLNDWCTSMALLAKQSNIYVKLSGLGTFLHRNDTAHIQQVVGATVGLFGANRCMFGSNFPIEKIWTDHTSLVNAHRAAVAHLPLSDQASVFSETARYVYRLAG
jgi:predicted TIM-barrel fold metal-dependent hydrolase